MLRRTTRIKVTRPLVFMMEIDRTRFKFITIFVIVQCIAVYIAGITILYCLWTPDGASFDFYKLASIMYLYDKKACGYTRASRSKAVTNFQLSNDTMGLDVLPIQWKPVMVKVSTRLSSKTRRYVQLSICFHVVWMTLAIILSIATKHKNHPHFLKYIVGCFFYAFLFMIFFDLSMAIVYVSHIRESLTKSMIVRYSGWGILLKLNNAEEFGGWLPLVASACWLRGVFVFALNIYSCRLIRHVHNKIKKREYRQRFLGEPNLPIPEAKIDSVLRHDVLYFRPGDYTSYNTKLNENR